MVARQIEQAIGEGERSEGGEHVVRHDRGLHDFRMSTRRAPLFLMRFEGWRCRPLPVPGLDS